MRIKMSVWEKRNKVLVSNTKSGAMGDVMGSDQESVTKTLGTLVQKSRDECGDLESQKNTQPNRGQRRSVAKYIHKSGCLI